ncbi:hypothetical protein Salat_1474300 [Sesamum alatum]|uniref:Uncharacterized protein n=1 Tax=Sesamum alatum TaxID=300844 RepID=A0AAE2CM80_9LAMI|nr:hypothetical protein Salat_1474300 [Sesamum alatum]
MAYAALISLTLTINRLRRSTQIPYINDSGIFSKMQEEIWCLQKLLGIVPRDDDSDDDDCKSLKDVTKEIVERTCRLEDLLEESQYHIGRDQFHGGVIGSATEMVKKMKEQLSNERLWPQQVKKLPSRDASQLQLATLVWLVSPGKSNLIRQVYVY